MSVAPPRGVRTGVAALVLAVLLAGCTGTDPGAAPGSGRSSPDAGQGSPGSRRSPESPGSPGSPGSASADAGASGRSPRYVALGDSYTAGPFVPRTDLSDGCFRSDGNYPSLLAGRLDLDLTDVSCGGAATPDLFASQRTPQETRRPPQARALDRRTDLVTLGIGGNDFGLFTDLLRTCLGARDTDPQGSPCRDELATRGATTDQLSARIGRRVQQALERVQRLAPRARVVLVGYPRISPTQGACPRRLPFASGDLATGRAVERSLDRALRAAARSAGVGFLDTRAASRGHDVCSEEPWVNGSTTRIARAAAFHPFARGMRGVTDALQRRLGDRDPVRPRP